MSSWLSAPTTPRTTPSPWRGCRKQGQRAASTSSSTPASPVPLRWRTSTLLSAQVPTSPSSAVSMKYIMDNDLWQKEYVANYTNASFLVNPAFAFDDATGLFSGWDDATSAYLQDNWTYQVAKRRPGTPSRSEDRQAGSDRLRDRCGRPQVPSSWVEGRQEGSDYAGSELRVAAHEGALRALHA